MKLTTNHLQFKADMAGFAKKIGVDYALVFKKVCFDLFGEIINRTPVDTGRAQNNWFMTEGSPSNETKGWPPKKGDTFPYPETPSLEISAKAPVFLTNNLPYIGRLEEGHSQQAPSGMVRLSMEKIHATIDRIAKE